MKIKKFRLFFQTTWWQWTTPVIRFSWFGRRQRKSYMLFDIEFSIGPFSVGIGYIA
jgi:hypothetical protein